MQKRQRTLSPQQQLKEDERRCKLEIFNKYLAEIRTLRTQFHKEQHAFILGQQKSQKEQGLRTRERILTLIEALEEYL